MPSDDSEKLDLWSKCVFTDEIIARADLHREQCLDLSWLPQYIMATLEDCVAREDLQPEWITAPALSSIWTTQAVMPLTAAFQSFVRGEIDVGSQYIVTVPSASKERGTCSFGFHMEDMMKTFDMFRFGISPEGPTVRLLFSQEDRPDLPFVDPTHPGEPVYRHGIGLGLLPNVHYEFLFDNPLPISYCWEFGTDTQDDGDAAQIVAFMITQGADCSDAIRMIKRDSRYMGYNYLSPMKFWLREWGVDDSVQGDEQACGAAFELLASGDFAMAAELLREIGLTNAISFVARRFAQVFGFEERVVRLYLS